MDFPSTHELVVNNALKTAVQNSLLFRVEVLVEQGEDLNKQDEDGHTALHHAVLALCAEARRMQNYRFRNAWSQQMFG